MHMWVRVWFYMYEVYVHVYLCVCVCERDGDRNKTDLESLREIERKQSWEAEGERKS